MPTPATPRHTAGPGRDGPRSSPTKPKPLDIGKALGPHDSNSVREKVRMWQQKGGGVATIKDAQAEPDGNETFPANKREKPTTLLDARRVTTRLKPVEKITLNVNGGGIRKRSQSTPRKRVVSDQHWRSQRSPTTTSKATKGPAPNRITNYKTNESFASSSPTLSKKKAHRKDNDSEIGSGAKTDSEELKSVASASTIPKKPRVIKTTKYIYTEDGLISDHETPQTCEASKASPSIQDQEPAPSVASNLRRATPPPIDDDDWAGSEANFSELSRRRRRGQPALKETLRDARKPKSGGLLNQVLDESRKMFAKPAPPRPPPPSNRGEKISAWLSAQPDPFVDDNDDTPVEIPAPLKTRPKAARPQSRDSESEITASHSSGISSANGTQPIKYKVAARSDSQRRSSVDKASEISMEKDGTSLLPKDSMTDAASGNLSKVSRRGSGTRSNRLSQVARDSAQDGNHGAYINGLEDMVLPLRLRRPFPTTGIHQLSTIASEETLSSTINDRSVVGSETNVSDADNEKRDHFDPDSLLQAGSSLQRRLTKHSDLMSILSNPKSTRRSQRSSRSVRSNRTRIGTATVTEILLELSSDETKYMRELRTLVGGVIPVLLSCVLSRSDSAIAAGLFRPSADPKDDINFTRPIVDMGVALERLKTLHKRIPTDETDALLSWAQGAQRVYRDYLKAWRMGFQDVVVNLAPRDEHEEEGDKAETYSLDQGMDQDESGDVVDADGEKVDVAYLLKRPLVRLKYLSKTFKGLDHAAHSPKTEQVAEIYQELVEQARRRSNEERARLEDESAAYVDSTRARSLDTLAVLPDVVVDKTRRVLARDFFNLSLIHSSGQMIDCHAELLLRDNASGNGPGGDLLICEIDDSDRWLLFPPLERSCVSARNGDSKGEIIVMIRGHSTPDETEWQELLSLTIDDEDIGFEWVNMLGLDPVPPALPRTQKFVDRSQSRRHKAGNENKSISLAVNKMKLVLPSSSEIDVPIGEQATVISHAGKSSVTISSGPSLVSSLSEATSANSLASDITRASDYALTNSPQTPTSPDARSTLPSAKELSDKKKLVDGKASPGLKRAKAKRRSRHEEQLTSANTTPRASPGPELETTKSPTPVSKAAPRFYAGKDEQASPKLSKDLHRQQNPVDNKKELLDDARVSSVPTMKMPTIPKVRKGTSNISTLSADLDNEDDDDNLWPDAMSSISSQRSYSGDESAPSPPPHRVSSQSSNVNSPILSPSTQRQKRRSSSPLKHEYEPSSASESSTESESSTVRHYDMGYSDSDTTDMSDEELSDNDDEISVAHRQDMSQPPASIPALDGDTLSPSNSASQGPYRSVPSQPTKASKAVAMLFFWSDKGKWESLYPDECEIVVTPGLIEAYKFGSHISGNSKEEQSRPDRPLVALELTPLVPIRRGTAIDISIRSPPTEKSRIKSSNNVMFRSQSVDECDILYGLINHSRINNPTYIALQNARGPYQPPSLARYNSTGSNKGTSWFGFPRRKNSYRAARHAPSIGMVSESSVGSMTSAFSALKKFGAGSKLFSIARSTVTSRTGSQDGSTVYSGPLGSSGLAAIAAAIKGADGIGLANAKIRLYVRESTTRWRDMGAARLTIMPVTPKTSRPGTAASSKSPSDVQGHEKTPRSSSYVEREAGEPIDERTADGTSTPTPGASPRRVTLTQEKRILIQGKTAGEVLLDVCLGESSFERVARTGIAISVWENRTEGTIQQKGGVNGGAFRIYMIQMKSEAEAAYTFGLVGKLRY